MKEFLKNTLSIMIIIGVLLTLTLICLGLINTTKQWVAEPCDVQTLLVSLSSDGQVIVRSQSQLLNAIEVSTPSESPYRGPFSYYRNEVYPDKYLLIIQFENTFTVFELPEAQAFRPIFDSDAQFQIADLKYALDGDILLAIRSSFTTTLTIEPTINWSQSP